MSISKSVAPTTSGRYAAAIPAELGLQVLATGGKRAGALTATWYLHAVRSSRPRHPRDWAVMENSGTSGHALAVVHGFREAYEGPLGLAARALWAVESIKGIQPTAEHLVDSGVCVSLKSGQQLLAWLSVESDGAGHLLYLGRCQHGSRELRCRTLGALAPVHALTNARLALCAMVFGDTKPREQLTGPLDSRTLFQQWKSTHKLR